MNIEASVFFRFFRVRAGIRGSFAGLCTGDSRQRTLFSYDRKIHTTAWYAASGITIDFWQHTHTLISCY